MYAVPFPGDKPFPGVSSGIICPLNDMLRYALNDRTTLEMTFFLGIVISTKRSAWKNSLVCVVGIMVNNENIYYFTATKFLQADFIA